MCVSNHFIEQEAYDFSEKIQKQSKYKFVRTEVANTHFNGQKGGQFLLISKVILEGHDGKLYSVSPNPNGLKFAKQEITFKEYTRLEKKETRNAVALFLLILSFFGGSMVTLIRFFT